MYKYMWNNSHGKLTGNWQNSYTTKTGHCQCVQRGGWWHNSMQRLTSKSGAKISWDRTHLATERQPGGSGVWSHWDGDSHCQHTQKYTAVCLPVRVPKLCPFHTAA